MADRLERYERELLAVLSEDGGFTTGRAAELAGIGSGHNARTASAFARQKLLGLQALGYVAPMDDLKPVAWQRTPAGTLALGDGDGR